MNKLSIISITKGPRLSNFELLRIVAMFLVLVFHADFWSLGDLTRMDYESNPANAWTRTVIGSISVICVNCFVLISGWFGIRPTLKGLCNFIFQWLFFYIGTYLVMMALGVLPLSVKMLAACFGISGYNWFIKAYLALYIIAPILNTFIRMCDKKTLRNLLIAFFVFQTLYGWTNSASFVQQGYSTFSFIGLYLLGRYVNIYKSNICKWGGVMLILSLALNVPLLAAQMYFGVGPGVHSYVNPMVITGALGFILWVSQHTIPTSNLVNTVSSSSFAVFLFHHAPAIGVSVFKPMIRSLYDTFSGIGCLGVIFVALVGVFLLAIVLDIPRKLVWRYISKRFFSS